nr:MAG: replication associated protein [Cressdnaviricota sp.]
MDNKAKRYCFTLNNYTETEYEEIISRLRLSSEYYVIGKETGETGTDHLQGYCCLISRCRLVSLKNKLNSRAHFEVARGTPSSNRIYCSKEGQSVEWGTIPSDTSSGQRKLNREEAFGEYRRALGSGRSGLDTFADQNPGIYGFHGHTMYRNAVSLGGAVERPTIHVEWIWGKPGVGKSRGAHARFPEAYIKDPRTKWWNGYCLEKECIIDDFGPQGIDINHLLRWFDRYKCYVEIKGDMCPLHVVSFIITSNFHPRDVFTDGLGCTHSQYPALERRIVINELL